MTKLPDLKVRHDEMPENTSRADLKRFLYIGGAASNAKYVASHIKQGELGKPKLERLELLLAIKEQLETNLIIGKSIHSVKGLLDVLTLLFKFLDKHDLPATRKELESNYILYSEYLFREVHKSDSRISLRSAHGYAQKLSAFFGDMLDVPYAGRLIFKTRLRYKQRPKKAVNKTAEKQNLESTFQLGGFLVDLIMGLTKESILGELPIRIPIRGSIVENNHILLFANTEASQDNFLEWSIEARKPVSSIEGTNRWQLVNLRAAAEFLLFVSQTGINNTQATTMKRERFKYKPVGDSFEVRCYKPRRKGEVYFEIYKSYRPLFENYISFISHFFPHSELLFPKFGPNGIKVSQNLQTRFDGIKTLILKHGIPWIAPSTLRNTRVNWLLRRSGDEMLTADIAQHTKEVLRSDYERPSQQRAMVEITRFWNKHDPISQGELTGSIIASQCNGQPKAIDAKPSSVVEPNCITPSGCLWCKHHRDVDSADYVWSLCSMRHLKVIESSLTLSRKEVPADASVNRIASKIGWYRDSSIARSRWVDEAELRVEEGYYHPNWSAIIEFLE